MADLGFRWYILHTETSRELIANKRLGESSSKERKEDRGLDFFAYCPLHLPPPKGKERYSRRSRRLRPIMPGYLFVLLHPKWSTAPLYTVPGLRTGARKNSSPFYRINGRPATLSASAMRILRELEAVLADEKNPHSLPYVVGGSIRITDGPFTNFVAEVTQVFGREQVEVLVEAFNRKVRTKLSAASVEPVFGNTGQEASTD